jgi:L-ascorbate metabolism protein UlaG (beta-lactamase superfamily)
MTAASVTFIGTATTLLRFGDLTVLTDPNFLRAGQRAYLGRGLWSKRRTDPALTIGELPDLDAVVLSHLHGDHFDRVARRGLPRDTPIITTRHAAKKLRRHFPTVGLPLWESEELRRGDRLIRITAVPGRHGPDGFAHLLPPVMGTIVDLEERGHRRLRLYITGDTLLHAALAEIPVRCPDIDVMLVHLGGTRLLGVTLTMDAQQGNDLIELIEPRTTIPIHYDDYPVFRSPLSDFLAVAADRRRLARIQPIFRGQTNWLPLRPEPEPASGLPEEAHLRQ